MTPTLQQQQAESWFRDLRHRIIVALETLEDEYAAEKGGSTARFEIKPWAREDISGQPGGGEMGLIRGQLFEKGGVNISTVWGEFSEEFRKNIPGAEDNGGAFWASGISLVIHPANPFIPPVHMNTRHIVTSKSWFGGGADLNPIYPVEDDTAFFHAELKKCCDEFGADYYERFAKWAEEYFWNKHRNEPRGVGGIFYDYLDDDWAHNFAFTKAVGETFLRVYPAIVRSHMFDAYDDTHKAHQLHRRGRYAEFNLLHDRGTVFGLKTGGNPEAILMSLPPLASW